MKSKRNFNRRILFSMAIMGLIPLIVMALESHYVGTQALVEAEQGHLGYAIKSRLAWLNAWLTQTEKEFHFASLNSCTQGNCTAESGRSNLSLNSSRLQSIEQGHASYISLATYDSNWNIIAVSPGTTEDALTPPADTQKKNLNKADGFVVTTDYTYRNGRVIVPIGYPTFDKIGTRIAYVVGDLDLTESFDRIFGNSSDLGETGRLFLVSKDGRYLWHPDKKQNLIGKKAHIPPELLQHPFQKVKQYRNEDGKDVVGIAGIVERGMDWLMMVEIEEEETFRWLNKGLLYGSLTGLATLVLLSFLAARSSKKLSEPLSELARVARNISEGSRHERAPEFEDQETGEVGEAFNHMLDRLEISRKAVAHSASLAAVGELSSSIVHEMRNPLSSIKINAQAVAQKMSHDPDYAEMSEIILQQTSRLEKMLTDLLQYGKPWKLQIQLTYFKHLADAAITAISSKALKKDITIQVVNQLQDVPLKVDNEKMIQALTNLLDNAVEWSPAGSTVLLSGRTDKKEKEYIISIRDNGQGIRENRLRKIFQPFFTTREEGTGLGLANLKKIIEYHGGTVIAENNETNGTEFSIKLSIVEMQNELNSRS